MFILDDPISSCLYQYTLTLCLTFFNPHIFTLVLILPLYYVKNLLDNFLTINENGLLMHIMAFASYYIECENINLYNSQTYSKFILIHNESFISYYKINQLVLVFNFTY
jgi:hypothetical protein